MPIDIIFIAVFGFGFWQGYNRGIIATVFNLIAYVFGITLAFKLTTMTANILERLFNTQNPTLFLIAFILNLVLIMFIIKQTAHGLEGIFQLIYLGAVNQIFGGLLMGGFAVLVYSVVLWFLVKVQFLNNTTLGESRTYPFLRDMPSNARQFALRFKPLANEVWGTSMDWMNRFQKVGNEKTSAKPKIYDLPDDGKGGIIEETPETGTPANSSNPKSSGSRSGIEN